MRSPAPPRGSVPLNRSWVRPLHQLEIVTCVGPDPNIQNTSMLRVASHCPRKEHGHRDRVGCPQAVGSATHRGGCTACPIATHIDLFPVVFCLLTAPGRVRPQGRVNPRHGNTFCPTTSTLSLQLPPHMRVGCTARLTTHTYSSQVLCTQRASLPNSRYSGQVLEPPCLKMCTC